MRQNSPPAALVVDDEFLIAIEIESILSEAGLDVVYAVNLPEAQRLLSERPVEVAVLDFRMGPKAHAFAADLIKSGVAVLFCTGTTAEEVRATFPAAPVISKPFVADELVRAVTAVLATKSSIAGA